MKGSKMLLASSIALIIIGVYSLGNIIIGTVLLFALHVFFILPFAGGKGAADLSVWLFIVGLMIYALFKIFVGIFGTANHKKVNTAKSCFVLGVILTSIEVLSSVIIAILAVNSNEVEYTGGLVIVFIPIAASAFYTFGAYRLKEN